MADPRFRIGDLLVAFVDELNERYGEGQFSVGSIAIVCDLVTEDGKNPVVYACDDPRKWVQAALLSEAQDAAVIANERREEEAAPDADA